VLTTANGSFSDGSGAAPYAEEPYCKWLIAPSRAIEVTITFTSFDLMPPYHSVSLYQCAELNCWTAQKISHITGKYSVVQKNFSFSTGYVLVIFQGLSNYLRHDGFTASWTSVAVPTASVSVVIGMSRCIFAFSVTSQCSPEFILLQPSTCVS
jgi:hypothetical protein